MPENQNSCPSATEKNIPKERIRFYHHKWFSKIGFALAVWLVVGGFAEFILSYIPLDWLRSVNGSYVVSSISRYGIALATFLAIMKNVPGKLKKTNIRLHWKDFGKYFFVCIGTAYLLFDITRFFTWITGLEKGIPTTSPLELSADVSFLYNLLIGTIAIPILEELIFRGVILSRLYRYGEFFALITSAALFCICHDSLSQVVYSFGIGLIFAYVTIITGQIRTAILLHMSLNLIGGIVIPALLDFGMAGRVIGIILILTFTIGGIITAHSLYPTIRFKQQAEYFSFQQKLKMFLTAPGVVIFMVLCFLNIITHLIQ